MTRVEGRATLRRMKLSRAAGVLIFAILAGAGPRSAVADDGLKPITIISPGERSTNNKAAIGGLAGATVLTGALGLYFHLDSKSASDDVGTDTFTGEPWSADKQDLVDRANRSRAAAITVYSLSGAFLIATVVYWIATDPPDETIVIQPRSAQPTIAPTPGGAVLGGMWSF